MDEEQGFRFWWQGRVLSFLAELEGEKKDWGDQPLPIFEDLFLSNMGCLITGYTGRSIAENNTMEVLTKVIRVIFFRRIERAHKNSTAFECHLISPGILLFQSCATP